MVLVEVSAPLHATEVPERVAKAVGAFWPDLSIKVEPDTVSGSGHDVEEFRRLVWGARIIDTVREQILERARGPTATFLLSKQAAMHDRINFPAATHALGDIRVRFTIEKGDKWADAEALAWWLCPETADGEIVA